MVVGLLVLEDSAVIAVRQRMRRSLGDDLRTVALVDLTLALVMIAYNFAASRFVANSLQALAVGQALDTLDERAQGDHRRIRRVVSSASPLALSGRIGGGIGQRSSAAGERLERGGHRDAAHLSARPRGRQHRRRARRRDARDPDRPLRVRPRAACVTARCSSHPGSPGRGDRVVVDAGVRAPVVGTAVDRVVRVVGSLVTAATDPTTPVGFGVLLAIAGGVAAYTVRVGRLARTFSTLPTRARSVGRCGVEAPSQPTITSWPTITVSSSARESMTGRSPT